LTPVIHGASGFGSAVENDLRDYADSELESNDLAEAGRALGREENVDASRIALVGHGLGGALALVTAGARPGVYGAVVAIDPITDWSVELGGADVAWRTWVTDRFGMPLTHADHYALRTPATFSAVIDVPIVLVRTERAPEHRKLQLDLFTEDLDELGIAYQVIEAPDEPLSATLRRIGREVAELFTAAG
jgi:dipeptidyl aminopeptidase/acylaminoacyl peptidase